MAVTIWKNVSVLRGAAILVVVFNHAAMRTRGFRMGEAFRDAPWTPVEVVLQLVAVTVPAAALAAFMVSSGYFMGRFSATWKASRAAARSLFLRWAAWSAAGFALLLAVRRSYTLESARDAFLEDFGPFPAYWFLPVMLAVLVVAPLLTRWAQRAPWSLAGTVVALEAARSVGFYLDLNRTGHVIPLETSFFLIGILLSQHTAPVVEFLVGRRRAVGWLALALLATALAETAWWWIANGGPTERVVSADRLGPRLFGLTAVAWLLVGDSAPRRWKGVLEEVGGRSLAILLTFDLFQQAVRAVAWHAPGLANAALEGPPSWLASPAFTVVYLLAGAIGPLTLSHLSERYLGKRGRQVLFG